MILWCYPFGLQTRIGRKTISKNLLAKTPVIFMAYDLIESGGKDIQEEFFGRRKGRSGAHKDAKNAGREARKSAKNVGGEARKDTMNAGKKARKGAENAKKKSRKKVEIWT